MLYKEIGIHEDKLMFIPGLLLLTHCTCEGLIHPWPIKGRVGKVGHLHVLNT